MTIIQLITLIVFGIPGLWSLIKIALAFRFLHQPLGHFVVLVFVICVIGLLVTFVGIQ